MITEQTYKRLAELDPDKLSLHSRYVSGSLFRDAIYEAQELGYREGSIVVEDLLQEALEATPGDGGNLGTIPCLGGEWEEVWQDWQAGR